MALQASERRRNGILGGAANDSTLMFPQTYRCEVEPGCDVKIKMVPEPLGVTRIMSLGVHPGSVSAPAAKPAYGIHPRFKALVDQLLAVGGGPGRIRQTLLELPAVLKGSLSALVPTARQISSVSFCVF